MKPPRSSSASPSTTTPTPTPLRVARLIFDVLGAIDIVRKIVEVLTG